MDKVKMKNKKILIYSLGLLPKEELKLVYRDVLFEFHLKFWNTASIGIPVRSKVL